jgi:hypothetical protein
MGVAAGDAMVGSWRVGRLCFLWPHGGGDRGKESE